MSDAGKRDSVSKPGTAGEGAIANTGAQVERPVVNGDDKKPEKRGVGWLSLAIAALFGLFYAYDVWTAIAPMVALPNFYVEQGLKQTDVPWWLLVIGLAVPIVTYVVAFLVGLRRTVPAKALIFILGFAVVSALGIGIVALELVIRGRLLEAVVLT